MHEIRATPVGEHERTPAGLRICQHREVRPPDVGDALGILGNGDDRRMTAPVELRRDGKDVQRTVACEVAVADEDDVRG
jgi:hypothetical protein